MVLDLDFFKRYNDAHGHPAGDALLVDVARAWGALLPGPDHLYRLGGDEFAVVLPGATGPRPPARPSGCRRPRRGGRGHSGSPCAARPHGGDLLQRADAALYAGKRAR